MKVWAYVSIGSNIEPQVNVRSAVAELARRFGELKLSSVYESPAVGFDGGNFYNLVAGFDTDESVQDIARYLREIEHRHGRVKTAERLTDRPLDLDLLLYGDARIETPDLTIPRPDITRYAFVLLPLAEIAPAERHPISGRSYAELWEAFDKRAQPLWPAPLVLEIRSVPSARRPPRSPDP
jgi:2-amino-4-hydroxy-6-hydroxymethyldihydropteridine diphosphokinase